jgi:hypothetical protein
MRIGRARRTSHGQHEQLSQIKGTIMGLLLLIILILLLLGGLPSWQYSRSWGYGPSGLVGLLLVVLVVLLIMERVPWGF